MNRLFIILIITSLISCIRQNEELRTSKDQVEPLSPAEETTKRKFTPENKKYNTQELSEMLAKHPETAHYSLHTESETFYLQGDFFGDEFEDIAILVKDSSTVKIAIINHGEKVEVKILGDKDDPYGMHDYKWIGIFEKVSKGETLWSNYIDDWREFKEVPEDEKVVLTYDAIYAHASESCGGGFIYWKDGKFDWLQQE